MGIAQVVIVGILFDCVRQMCTLLRDDDRHDHSVDTEDTCHDDWDERLHNYCWFPDGDAADSCACLSGAVGSSKVFVGYVVYLPAQERD